MDFLNKVYEFFEKVKGFFTGIFFAFCTIISGVSTFYLFKDLEVLYGLFFFLLTLFSGVFTWFSFSDLKSDKE